MALRGFALLSPFVTAGHGLICLHDTHPISRELTADEFCSNAWEAAVEIRRNPEFEDFEIVTLPGPRAGLSIIRKATSHLSWDRGASA